MIRKIFFTGIMLFCSMALSAQDWIDVTDSYVVNPRFDGNQKTGWEWDSNAGSQMANYEAFEFWYGYFDIKQVVQVPAGKYRVSVQAYYRTNDNEWAYQNYRAGNEDLSAYLYANDEMVQLKSIYSEPLSVDIGGCWTPDYNQFFPNNMYSGSYAFAQGLYNNQLEVEVDDSGFLLLGVQCYQYNESNWCMMDNFKLEKYGTLTYVDGIELSSTNLELTVGEEHELAATVMPADATYTNLGWSSSNTSVAVVDAHGKVAAVGDGTAVITVYAMDGSGVSATCAVTVQRGAASVEALIINELQAANVDMYVDPSFNYGSWVELYNPTNQTVSLQGLYVSDDPENLKKYRLTSRTGVVPAMGYKVLWFDHFSDRFAPTQIDGKLDYDGGTICISDADGQLICSQVYPEAIGRTSYARLTDGGAEWGITSQPTPGESNNGSPFTAQRLEAPIVDKDACLFTSPFTVKVTIPAGATLKYTTDGTTPTESNGLVSTNGRFTVNYTTTFRFRLFQDGYLPSRVITRSYLYMKDNFGLPVVSVVTDPINLYDDYMGIYVKGVNGRTGNGQDTPCNWNMDWDRPVNFEYLTADGEMVVNMEAHMEMCGGWSRAWMPHSFKIKANKIYEGENYIPYQIFPNKSYLKHKTLQIRNGGNDTGSRIKDAALQAIVHTSGLDVDGQECQPVIHFINGEYIGLLNIREPNNKHFVEANYALDEDEIDQFEMSPDSGYVQKCGTEDSFLRWYDLSSSAEDEAVYEEICNLVDIDEYINYMAVEFYLGGTDWPQNNIKGFKPRAEGGKFRFVLFDLDGTFATTDVFNTFANKRIHTFDYIYDTHSLIREEIKWVTIFLNMIKNDTFRKQFIDTYCLVAGSVFEPERCNAIIDSMAHSTERALAYEGNSPWNTANDMKSRLKNRQQQMINALKNYASFNLSAWSEQRVILASNVEQARLMVNGLEVPTGKFNGSLFAPITLKAVAPAGYRFAGWNNVESASTVLIERGASWRYYDQGSLDGTDWIDPATTVTGWGQGYAPLGYYTGDNGNSRGYKTFLDYGGDANNKRVTYYFRKGFTLQHTPSDADVYTLNYTVDDGMVVYVNGKEAARYLMPSGNVGYNTVASTYAEGNPDVGSLVLPASLFKKGENLITVEVHNNNTTSTDIYFDAELMVAAPQVGDYFSTEEEIELPSDLRVVLTACYEPIPEDEMLTAHNVPVRINEVSADNGIYVNPTYFKKNDWIELFNTTDRPVDVAGMYLTDKEDKPYKFQIPVDGSVNTVIPAKGYLIVWADKLEPVQQLHVTFKLDDEGGCVMLTAADESWKDILYYPQHAGDKSVGLYPDGGMQVYLMNTPTIAAPNFITSYAEYLAESTNPNGMGHVELHDGTSLYASYAEGNLRIVASESGRVSVSLYAATGQNVMTTVVPLVDGQGVVSVGDLPTGIYIVLMQDECGNTSSLKLLVR